MLALKCTLLFIFIFSTAFVDGIRCKESQGFVGSVPGIGLYTPYRQRLLEKECNSTEDACFLYQFMGEIETPLTKPESKYIGTVKSKQSDICVVEMFGLEYSRLNY